MQIGIQSILAVLFVATWLTLLAGCESVRANRGKEVEELLSQTRETNNRKHEQDIDMKVLQAFLATADEGDTGDIQNPSSGRHRQILVDQIYFSASGRLCKRIVWVDDVRENGRPFGQVACRKLDGDWYLVREIMNTLQPELK